MKSFGPILYSLVLLILFVLLIVAVLFAVRWLISPKYRFRRRIMKINKLNETTFITEKLNDMKSFRRQYKVKVQDMKDNNKEYRLNKQKENLQDKNNNIKVSIRSKFQATHANRILRNILGKREVEQSIVRNAR